MAGPSYLVSEDLPPSSELVQHHIHFAALGSVCRLSRSIENHWDNPYRPLLHSIAPSARRVVGTADRQALEVIRTIDSSAGDVASAASAAFRKRITAWFFTETISRVEIEDFPEETLKPISATTSPASPQPISFSCFASSHRSLLFLLPLLAPLPQLHIAAKRLKTC